MRDHDVAILGGGLAGTAAALALGRAGARVVLLEREAVVRPKVCGEFLSPAALAELAALGLSAAALGAIPIGTFRLAARDRASTHRLPFRAASLTRTRLDPALLDAAAEVADVRRGVLVRTVRRDGTGWTVGDGAAALRADRLVIATGKHDLPGRHRPAGIHPGLVGLKTYVAPSPAARTLLGDAVEIHLFPHGYCGIQAVEDGRINLCLVVAATELKRLGSPAAVFDALRRSSGRAAALMDGIAGRALAVAHIPYGFVRGPGGSAYSVGDQAAVVPSFCGEGMALALLSGRLAAEAIIADAPAAAMQRTFSRSVGVRVRAAALVSRLLVRAPLQPPFVAVARNVPAAVQAVARLTRTPAGGVSARRTQG